MATAQKLRGLVGQAIRGRRRTVGRVLRVDVFTSGSGTAEAPSESCMAYLYLIGGGGSSGALGPINAGGGGGGASFARFPMTTTQRLAYSVGVGGGTDGTHGGASSVTLPDGRVLGATGGISASGAYPGPGGFGEGGARNYRGGSGGTPSGGVGGGIGGSGGAVSGGDGFAGGPGNGGSAGGGGGGAGAPGFHVGIYQPGSGASGTNGDGSTATNYGGGGGGGTNGTRGGGGGGLVIIVYVAATS